MWRTVIPLGGSGLGIRAAERCTAKSNRRGTSPLRQSQRNPRTLSTMSPETRFLVGTIIGSVIALGGLLQWDINSKFEAVNLRLDRIESEIRELRSLHLSAKVPDPDQPSNSSE